MKVVVKIAKTELRALFYSPIAWFLMIVFLIQCGVVYLGQLDMVTRQQEISGSGQGFFTSLTDWTFLSQMGLFNAVMRNLYLYIPLLTMGLISREMSSGTIKLLYSSPIRIYEIVFGKYLAMMAYSLVLVLIVSIFLVSGVFHIQHAEYGILLSAMLGFYLLLCAYSAIGLFMSCLTGYQVVAAISTFVMIGILSYVGRLWQSVNFVRELTYFLSINGRTQKMLAGLITTKDLLYFIIIVYIFLGLSIYKLKSGMESIPVARKAARYVAIVASALLIGYVSSMHTFTGYYDATFNKSRTLTPQVQRILKDMGNEPLEVTAYVNLLDRFYYLGNPTSYNANLDRWESYMRFKHNIVLKKVMYYDSVTSDDLGMNRFPGKDLKEVAKQYAKGMDVDLKNFLAPDQIHKIIDLRPEENRYVMQLKWKGRTTFLRVFNDMMVWPDEPEVAAALQRLQHTTLPRIAFVTGDLERDINKAGDREYKTLANLPSFRNSLVNQGFDVMNVSLENEEIPDSISVLVLADPKIALPASTMNKLKQYINNGGNLLVAGEPGRQTLLNPILSELGVQLMAGTIIQQSKDDAPNFVSADLEKASAAFYSPLEDVISDSLKLTMPGVAGLSIDARGSFMVQPLVKTDAKSSWNRLKPIDLEVMVSAQGPGSNAGNGEREEESGASGEGVQHKKRLDSLGTVTFSATDGDVRGPITTVAALTRKINGKEQRIVVTGDADFLCNKELARYHTANFTFSTSLFRWMSNGEFPIDTKRPKHKDKRTNTTLDQIKFLRIVYLWVLPAILLVFGSILLVRRKRK